MSIKKDLSIGEAARQCDCSIKQIRHWAEKHYIPEPERVICGERAYRMFGADDLELIKGIKSYLNEGYRLPVAAKKAVEEILTKGGSHYA